MSSGPLREAEAPNRLRPFTPPDRDAKALRTNSVGAVTAKQAYDCGVQVRRPHPEVPFADRRRASKDARRPPWVVLRDARFAGSSGRGQ
jgi:hypothetical protein